jgi:sulfur relay (sulfurtransferase) DsrC/TusE family protein
MLRIDEIYNNTFWPWLRANRPGFRAFFCEPFGRSDADSVMNYGRDDIHEHNYIFFFDQEPIHLNIHTPTFLKVRDYNLDITHNMQPPLPFINGHHTHAGYLLTSEKDSENVDIICAQHKWKSLYYFFHGWAALDWYRGYNKTFLITPPTQRQITKTFIAPNRIVAGERQHRLEMLYHIFKNGLTNNHISCPAVCPAENISILDAVKPLSTKYPDIESVFAGQTLPINFAGETDHPMHSCWLSLFDESAESLLYLVTETVATGHRLHLTEKTFKPIALGMPFVIVGTKGSLEYLRSYGFRTFEGIWDESYDNAEDDVRIQRIASLLRSLDELSPEGKQDLFEQCRKVIEHNWNHFYGGGFESVLWTELNEMLNEIEPSC